MIDYACDVHLGINVKLGGDVRNGTPTSPNVLCTQRPLHEFHMLFCMK